MFIFFAAKEYKDVINGGYLHFWQGISIGFIVSIPAILIFSLFLFFILSYDTSLIEVYKNGAIALLKNNEAFYTKELGAATLKAKYELIETMKPSKLIQVTFRNKLFAAFWITPIVAIILRRK